MLRLTPDARSVLTTASEIARFRGAPTCGTVDVALALAVDGLQGSLYADALASPSPQMLGYDDVLQALLGSDAEVDLAALRSATVTEREQLRHRLA
ncbi:hypothetical protein CCE01nite_12010 [Cellulomonas cellasea]|uniref:Uncharacterized protein n=1 Tax=Cellulomonas cellasea TaxID=43670 RepID=A0A4Y3KT59_9CELL|nr:hypothetical protein CCE01nite_12010 [Cellulomonas cellasea]